MTDVTTSLLARFRGRFPSAQIPLALPESIETLNDKWRLYGLARELALPVPRTHLLDPADLRRGATDGFVFPFVLKPVRSRTFVGSRWVTGSVHYIASPSDIPAAFASDPCLEQIPYLIQEHVPGWGQGIFALFDSARPITFFAHKRIREKPPTGGVSVLSESVPLDPDLVGVARRLLGAVCWHGVAMVEFKVTSTGAPYLMEVNTRFWGSLQLAIDAGVDFPWLLYQLATKAPLDVSSSYATGLRNRWLLGDLDNLYLSLRHSAGFSTRMRAVLAFLQAFGPRTRYEVNRWDDLQPSLLELRRYVADFFA
jgi:predicted ATP-grasp superfamily ATP-dependent carboligase